MGKTIILKSLELYEKEGYDPHFYLNAVYEITTDEQIVEITFNKIRLPFTNSEGLTIRDDPSRCVDTKLMDIGDCCFPVDGPIIKKIVATTVKEMTLSEIEATLGYKVKIVDEKKENNE